LNIINNLIIFSRWITIFEIDIIIVVIRTCVKTIINDMNYLNDIIISYTIIYNRIYIIKEYINYSFKKYIVTNIYVII